MSASFVPPSASPATVADVNPLLLDAKNIYVTHLSDIVGPYIISTLSAMYAASKTEGWFDAVKRFREKLREIKLWNATIIEQHTATIETKHPYLGELIAAAFVAYVKVMSSIKLRDDKPNIRLKLPTNATFVHKAFVNVARAFYENPQLAAHPEEYTEMRSAIQQTIQGMLPIQDILKAYLGNAVDEEHTVSPVLDDGAQPASPEMFQDAVCAPAEPCEEVQTQPCDAPLLPPLPEPTESIDPADAPQRTEHSDHPEQSEDCKTIKIPAVAHEGGAQAEHPSKPDLFSDAEDDGADWK